MSHFLTMDMWAQVFIRTSHEGKQTSRLQRLPPPGLAYSFSRWFFWALPTPFPVPFEHGPSLLAHPSARSRVSSHTEPRSMGGTALDPFKAQDSIHLGRALT